MTFEKLKSFLTTQMRMQHIYQPLLIKSLLEAGGLATIRQLAVNFSAQDESQIMYYEKRLKEMPIKVLSKHGIIDRQGELVSLNTGKLSFVEKAELLQICTEKIQNYMVSNGLSIWDYRLLDYNPIPDSLRYRVLTEAKGRCALCGATKDERVLDVDHIIPRNKGGKTVYENLQVLCSKCNRSKQDQDDTDFRQITQNDFQEDCLFCIGKKPESSFENDYAYIILGDQPITAGHSLVVPKRHFENYFEITGVELKAVNDLLRIKSKELQETDKLIQGFRIEINSEKEAGEIGHCHVHLIPRRT